MSYLVLARKYRPASFGDVVGQEHVVRTLKNAIAQNRVHHAFLFTGARGVGKTTTARVLARALNCEQGPTVSPCGACAACREIAAGSHPDVLEIDGASNRGVDNVRELRETVRYLPSRGRLKLYIIDEVHQLTSEAFNALLKTLEEPPPHVKFIFATTEPQKIPATILSRCQRFDFRRVASHVIAEHVRQVLGKENLALTPPVLAAIVRQAQGSIRDALSLLEQALSYGGGDDAEILLALGVIDRQVVFDIVEAVLARNADPLLMSVAEVDAHGHDLAELAQLVVEHLRDLLVVKAATSPQSAVLDRAPGELETLKAQAARVSAADLHRYFALMMDVVEDTARAPYPRIAVEVGLLRLLEVEPVSSLSHLLERLEGAVTGEAKPVSARAPKAALSPASGRLPSAASGEAAGGWGRLVQRVRAERPALASVLEHGSPLAFGPEGVEITYVRGTFYWEAAVERGNRELLERMLAEHFGRPVTLALRAVDGGGAAGGTLAGEEIRRREVRDREIRDGAVRHPKVQEVIAVLGGEIKEVIPLAGEE